MSIKIWKCVFIYNSIMLSSENSITYILYLNTQMVESLINDSLKIQ